jgi:hypothetical protein
MRNVRITKKAVDALSCPAVKDRAFLWDHALAGFGVCAFPSGKKVYVVQYRQAGRSRRVAIGEHGRLTPEEARGEAKKLLGAVEKGSDPVAERRAAREVGTFRAVAEDWLRLHVRAKRKSRTAEEYERLLSNRIYPSSARSVSSTSAGPIWRSSMRRWLKRRAPQTTP